MTKLSQGPAGQRGRKDTCPGGSKQGGPMSPVEQTLGNHYVHRNKGEKTKYMLIMQIIPILINVY